MANPQLENGHLRIANEIWENLMRAGLTGIQWDLVASIIRRSWGFNRKEAAVSLTVLCGDTGRSRARVSEALSELSDRRILVRTKTAGFCDPAVWRVNKDWESWGVALDGTVARTGTVARNVPKQLPETEHPRCPKRNTYKDSNAPLRGAKDKKDICPEPKIDSGPPVIHLPTNRKGEQYAVPSHAADEWRELYPAVNVDAELRKMRGWLLANSKKRKTSGGMPRFIASWLAREQDRGGTATQAPKTKAERLAELQASIERAEKEEAERESA